MSRIIRTLMVVLGFITVVFITLGMNASHGLQWLSKSLTMAERTHGHEDPIESGNKVSKTCTGYDRRNHIKQACQVTGWVSNAGSIVNELPNMLVDHYHKLAYCGVPKVASRSMRTTLGSLATGNISFEEDGNYLERTGFQRLGQMTRDHQYTVMGEYKKLILVRHPYDRLVSAYRNKLVHAGRLNIQALTKNIPHINRYFARTQNRTSSFDPAKETLSFSDFIGLISTEYDNGFYDNHWATMSGRCDPCNISYDFVLRLETLPDDYPLLASYLQPMSSSHSVVSYRERMKSTELEPDEKLDELLLEYVDLDSVVMSGLRDVYRQDLDVFGYTWNDKSGAGCRIMLKPKGEVCC